MPFGFTQRFRHLGIKPKFVVTFISASLISTLIGSLVIKNAIEVFQTDAHLKLAKTISSQEKQRLLSIILPDVALSQAIANDKTLQAWAEDEFNPELRKLAMVEFKGYGEVFSSGQFFYILDESKNYYTNYSQGVFFPTKILYQLDLSKANFNWYTEATQTKSKYLINLDNDEYTDEVFVWVNTPVRNNNRVLGLAGTGFPVTDFLGKYALDDAKKSVNMVVDDKGSILIRNGEFFLDRFSVNKKHLKSRKKLESTIGDKNQYQRLLQIFDDLKIDHSQSAAIALEFDGGYWLAGISYLPELGWYNFSLLNIESLVNNEALETSFTIFLISTFTLIVLGLFLVDKTILSRVRVLHQKVDRSYQHKGQKILVLEGDELTQLGCAFDNMSNTLHASMTELESKVSERTQLLKEKNLQLAELALTDPLTGLLNRRGMVDRFTIEIERGKRENSSVGVAMIDIDDFKKVNDRYGHDVGDVVIRSCGETIADSCRATDVAARWGGEEFLIVVPNATAAILESILVRLLGEVRKCRINTKQGELKYTVSVGVSIMNPITTDMVKMVSVADDALYYVKKAGKDNFHLAEC